MAAFTGKVFAIAVRTNRCTLTNSIHTIQAGAVLVDIAAAAVRTGRTKQPAAIEIALITIHQAIVTSFTAAVIKAQTIPAAAEKAAMMTLANAILPVQIRAVADFRPFNNTVATNLPARRLTNTIDAVQTFTV